MKALRFFCEMKNDEINQIVFIPFEDARDTFDEPDVRFAVSGICVSNALKKLYSYSHSDPDQWSQYIYESKHNEKCKRMNGENKQW